jgi:hypothetical protein
LVDSAPSPAYFATPKNYTKGSGHEVEDAGHYRDRRRSGNQRLRLRRTQISIPSADAGSGQETTIQRQLDGSPSSPIAGVMPAAGDAAAVASDRDPRMVFRFERSSSGQHTSSLPSGHLSYGLMWFAGSRAGSENIKYLGRS